MTRPGKVPRRPGGPEIRGTVPGWRRESDVRAIGITGRGEPPAVVELADPRPGPGEVRVAVQAASVNGFDVAVAAGYVWDALPHEFPVVLGRDVVGTVESVGEGVDGPPVGGRVAGAIAGVGLGPHGTLGELCTMAAGDLATVPDGVPSEQAAALGLAAVTALDVVTALESVPTTSSSSRAPPAGWARTSCSWPPSAAPGSSPRRRPERVPTWSARSVPPPRSTTLGHRLGGARAGAGRCHQGRARGGRREAARRPAGRRWPTGVRARRRPGGGGPGRRRGHRPAGPVVRAEAGVAARRRRCRHLTVPEPRSYPMAQVAEALDAFAAGKLGKIVVTVP